MKEFHFFASSFADWAATTEDRDLPGLIDLMNDLGYGFNLYMVPGGHDSQYEIRNFMPQVEGTIWLGKFDVKKKRK